MIDRQEPVDPQREANVRAYHYIEATVELAGSPTRVVVSVREDNNGSIYYNHGLPDAPGAAQPWGTGPAPRDAGGVSPEAEGEASSQEVGASSDGLNLTLEQTPPRRTGVRYEQAAWHGSPHLFDRFSTDAVGSGEGAQVYGWGLYFASKRGIAEHYRRVLSRKAGREIVVDGQPASGLTDAQRDAAESKFFGHDPAEEVERADRVIANFEAGKSRGTDPNHDATPWNAGHEEGLRFWRELREAFAWVADREVTQRDRTGRLFSVEVPEDGELLDHDALMTEQPPAVLAALRASDDPAIVDALGYADRIPSATGGRFYKMLEDAFSSIAIDEDRDTRGPQGWDRDASKALLAAGVKGIRYLDASSRDAGEGSHNFVVFSDSDVEVREFWQRRRGAKGPGSKGPRGSITFIPGRPATLRLFAGADLSTVLHESGHFFLEVLAGLATTPGLGADTAPVLTGDFATLLDWFGIDRGDGSPDALMAARGTITVEHHEKLAGASRLTSWRTAPRRCRCRRYSIGCGHGWCASTGRSPGSTSS